MRLAELRAIDARCHAATAHELVRLLAMDGQGDAARVFADTYETGCGADPVVRHWGDAPHPRATR